MKRYSEQNFSATINGTEYNFHAYTTDTRNGFCHTVVCDSHDITNTKVSYENRTYESFKYASALSRAIDKFPKEEREELTAILIEHKTQEIHEKCEKEFEAFKNLYNSMSDRGKEIMKSYPTMESEEDVKGAERAMMMLNLLGV